MLRNIEQRIQYINDSSNWIKEDSMMLGENIEILVLFRLRGTDLYKAKIRIKNPVSEGSMHRNFPHGNSILLIENGYLKETMTEMQAAKFIMNMKEWLQ